MTSLVGVQSYIMWFGVLIILETDEPGAVLCLYKTDDDCVMKFTYSEHASGQSVLTALTEPGELLLASRCAT